MSEPLWLDELHTSWVVSGSPGEVHQRAWEGNQMPLYYWLVWPASKLTGGNPFGLRLISLIASLATLMSLTWIVFSWGKSHVAAMLVAALAAADDKFLFYSVEARPYALVQLAGVWQMACFAWAVTRWKNDGESANRPGAATAWTAGWLAVLMLWLQLTTIVLLAAEALYLVVACIQNRELIRTFRPYGSWIGYLLMGLAAAWPLVATLLLVENSDHWLRFIDPVSLTLGVLADVFVWTGIPLAASLVLYRFRIAEDSRVRVWALFGISGIAITSAIILTFSGLIPLADYRYLIAPISGLLLCGGLVLAGLPEVWKCAVALLILVVAIASNPLLPDFCKTGWLPAQRVEDWGAIVDKINSDKAPLCFFPNLVEDGVLAFRSSAVLHSRQEEDYFLFALAGTRKLEGLEDESRICEAFSMINQGLPSERMRAAIAGEKGCWILIRARPEDAKVSLGKAHHWPHLRFSPDRTEDFSIPPLNLFRVRVNEGE